MNCHYNISQGVMTKYKITSHDDRTRNNTIWGPNVTHETLGEGSMCSSGWLHYYHSPELAALLHYIHVDVCIPKLWECKAEGDHLDYYGLKGCCSKLTTLHEIPLPKFKLPQRIALCILHAKQLCKEPQWIEWADSWLEGKDRTIEASNYIWKATTTTVSQICALLAREYALQNKDEFMYWRAASALDLVCYEFIKLDIPFDLSPIISQISDIE